MSVSGASSLAAHLATCLATASTRCSWLDGSRRWEALINSHKIEILGRSTAQLRTDRRRLAAAKDEVGQEEGQQREELKVGLAQEQIVVARVGQDDDVPQDPRPQVESR